MTETITLNWGQLAGLVLTAAITILSYIYMSINEVKRNMEKREEVIFASINKKEQESKDSFKDVDQRIDYMTKCNLDVNVKIAEINTNLEVVKSQNNEMSIDIKQLIRSTAKLEDVNK